MQNNTWAEWTRGFFTTRGVTWREFCSSVWQIPARHSQSPQPEPLWAQLLLGRESLEAGESLPSSNVYFHNLHSKECPFNLPAIDHLISWSADGMWFPHLEARWGEAVPEVCLCLRDYLLSGMLNSALQRQECKRQCGGGGRRGIQKDGKAAKCISFGTPELDFQDLKSFSHLKEK